jgi:hypothetical protein
MRLIKAILWKESFELIQRYVLEKYGTWSQGNRFVLFRFTKCIQILYDVYICIEDEMVVFPKD